jgi:hypothetical protein
MTEVYAIKIKFAGEKKWAFLAGEKRTYLRVHASRFHEREAAQLCVDKSAPANPGTEWKVVRL